VKEKLSANAPSCKAENPGAGIRTPLIAGTTSYSRMTLRRAIPSCAKTTAPAESSDLAGMVDSYTPSYPRCRIEMNG
jgi:hypothetical protein